MSRDVNIDLTKSLKSHDKADLQYALDRGLIPVEERQRVHDFLTGEISGKSPKADAEEMEENERALLATLDGSVGEVVARIEGKLDGTYSRDDIEALKAAESAGKDRKGVHEYLDSIVFEGEDGGGAEGETES